jgi:hypothetical protein
LAACRCLATASVAGCVRTSRYPQVLALQSLHRHCYDWMKVAFIAALFFELIERAAVL